MGAGVRDEVIGGLGAGSSVDAITGAGPGVGIVLESGDGVEASPSKRFSYQITRSFSCEADNRSRSPSPSRSTAITCSNVRSNACVSDTSEGASVSGNSEYHFFGLDNNDVRVRPGGASPRLSTTQTKCMKVKSRV